MKVLYVQDSLGTGGAERSNAELWYYLRKQDVEINIVVLEHRKEGIENEILEAGFDVTFLSKGSFFSEVNQLKKLIKAYQPDLVHSSLLKSNLRVRFAKLWVKFIHVESLVNCTYASIRYNDPRVDSKVLKLYEKTDKVTQKFGVDHFIAITKEVQKHYQEHFNISNNRISVIYRGRKPNLAISKLDTFHTELKKELSLPKDSPIFINVGRQEFQKAHIDILKAIKIADQELSAANAQFLFCGRRGNASPEIDNFMENNNLKTKIQFLGHRNDIYKLLAISDVFVFPSLYEGLGGALIEAQAARLPIICSDIPVFHEVVEPSKNALLFEVQNAKKLSLQLIKLANNAALREEMGAESLKNFQVKFQLESVNQQMLDKYKKLLN